MMSNDSLNNDRVSWWITVAAMVLIAGLAASFIPVLLTNPTDSVDEVEQQLHNASAKQRAELQRKRTRFDALSETEQGKLRVFHDELTAHPDCVELQEILEQYNDWLMSLSPAKRAEIQDLEVEERIKAIREVREEEARRRLGFYGPTKLPDGDIPRIYQWIDDFVLKHEQDILELLSSQRRAEIAQIDSPDRRRRRIAISLSYLPIEESAGLVKIEDVESFFNNLSAEAREILSNRATNDDRMILVQRWILRALFARRIPRVSDAELEKFYREELSETQRDQLDRMPPDQRKQRIGWMYQEWSQNRSTRQAPGDGSSRQDRGSQSDDQSSRNGASEEERSGQPSECQAGRQDCDPCSCDS